MPPPEFLAESELKDCGDLDWVAASLEEHGVDHDKVTIIIGILKDNKPALFEGHGFKITILGDDYYRIKYEHEEKAAA